MIFDIRTLVSLSRYSDFYFKECIMVFLFDNNMVHPSMSTIFLNTVLII